MDLFEHAAQTAAAAVQTLCTAPAKPVHAPGSRPANELPDEFHRLAQALQHCHGADHAVTATDLAGRCGIKPDATDAVKNSTVRGIISRHMIDFAFPVLAGANGYFRASTPEEMTHYHRTLHSRIREIAIRIRSLKHQGALAGFHYDGHCTWTQ